MVRRRKMRAALELTVDSDSRLSDDRHAALLHLCRLLADQIDAAGPKGAPTHLMAAYLSALKDVGRVLGAEEKKEPVRVSKLGELRSVHQIA